MFGYFTFYQLEPKFHLDEAALRKAFIQIQREWHPDFFAGEPEKQAQALEMTAKNNDAYKALGSLLSRVHYIISELDSNQPTEKNVLPLDFLSDMMDLNDTIQEALMGDEAAKSKATAELDQWEADEMRQLELQTKALDMLPNWDLAAIKPVKMTAQKMSYLSRLRKNLNGVDEM